MSIEWGWGGPAPHRRARRGDGKECQMPMQFTSDDLEVMERLRNTFNPEGLRNPPKDPGPARGCKEVLTRSFRSVEGAGGNERNGFPVSSGKTGGRGLEMQTPAMPGSIRYTVDERFPRWSSSGVSDGMCGRMKHA